MRPPAPDSPLSAPLSAPRKPHAAPARAKALSRLPTAAVLSLLVCGGICGVLSACGGSGDAVGAGAAVRTAEPAMRTQALLLTQDFPYDNARKDSIAGDYVRQTRVEVPADLAPQNKWVMFEGPVLENDQVAYRFYMDDRHRFDIYGKRVADLVMDTVGWDYHDVMDWGADVLKVGNSLGMGSPAVLYEDSVYTFSNAARKVVEVTEAGGERAAVRTTFEGLRIGDQTVTITEDWSLPAGTPAARVELRVTQGVLPKGARLATGVVIHDTEAQQLSDDDELAVYSYGDQSYHGDGLGMAVVAEKNTGAQYRAHPLSHMLVFAPDRDEAAYEMVAAWELGVEPVRSVAEFEAVLEEVMKP